MRTGLVLGLIGLTGASGCLDNGRPHPFAETGSWKNIPFTTERPAPPVLSEASTEVASRVDSLGRDILAANPDLSIEPIFITLGVDEPALFHRGGTELYISEGLVKQCQSDGELVALLCLELGQMVTEDAARHQGRPRDEPPPLDAPLSADVVGSHGAPDQTRLAELARFEQSHQRRLGVRSNQIIPAPRVLARGLLVNSGFGEEELRVAEPLAHAAKANRSYERQLNGFWRNPLQ